jgi:hypothetical protein
MNDSLRMLFIGGADKTKDNKGIHNETQYIHSINTFKTYKQQINHFADWCQEMGYRHLNDEIDDYVFLYLAKLQTDGKSAYTQATALAAIAKALKRSTTSFGIELPKRQRADIKRSRYDSTGDSKINLTNYTTEITFAKCFGLRKHKEMEVIQKKDIYEVNGTLYAHVASGKGGRPREVEFCGSREEYALLSRFLADKDRNTILFPKVPAALDIHAYRRMYAQRVYRKYARPLETLTKAEKYICRKDKRGKIYDRRALRIVSKALGHNRESVAVNNYLD